MANKPLKTLKFDGGDTYYLAPDYNNIENKPTSMPPTDHNHMKSEITDFPTTEIWAFTLEDGSTVNKVVYVENSLIISFIASGKTYYAERGMTWEEWIYSDYNTDDFYTTDDGNGFVILPQNSITAFMYNGNVVHPTDTIISGGVYTQY